MYIVEEVTPTIDKVTDSDLRDIPSGTSTTDTTVILTGEGTENLSVDIYDDGDFLRTVPVPASGTWTATFSGLARTGHCFVAKSRSLESAAWSFTVVAELVFDTSDLRLNGRLIIIPGIPLVRWPADTSRLRQASGGLPSYTYSSSNSGIATVDNLGNISSRSNGTVTVTVEDKSGQRKSCQVIVSNVMVGQILYLHNLTEAANKGRILTIAELETVKYTYDTVHSATGHWGDGRFTDNYWSSDWVSGPNWRILHLFNGTPADTAASHLRIRAIVV